MKQLIFLFLLFLFIWSCQKDAETKNEPYQYIPNKSKSIIKVNELNYFLNTIENHDILSSLYNVNAISAFKVLKHLKPTQPVFIVFSDSAETRSNYLILTKNNPVIFDLDSVTKHTSTTLLDVKIEKTQIDSTVIYHKVMGNIFAGSNDLELLKRINSKNEDLSLSKLIKTTDKKSVASLLFTSDSKNFSKLLFTDFPDKLNDDNYNVLDLAFKDKSLRYNGLKTLTDSVTHPLNSFENTQPQKLSTIKIAPNDTKSFMSISYNDFSVFKTNLRQEYRKTTDSSDTFLNYTNEIALIDDAIIIHSFDPKIVLETIEEKSNINTFRGIDIYEFSNFSFFKSRLMPFISFEDSKFFALFENNIVFTTSQERLKSILTSGLNNSTLVNSEAFKSINKSLSNESSIFIFKNSDGLSEILKQPVKGYRANAVQYVYENHYAHVNGIIQKFKRPAKSNSVTEAFTIKLDAELISAPQTLKNHITKTHDIAVQDVNNMLYLISDSGNILWKKKLRGKILGAINQIDIYKNGRLQLAFATANQLYVLDRNGNDVSSFPLKFKDEITQPLAVFDYDKQKKYRLLITQDKDLLMYDANGQIVSGFNYKSNGYKVKSQPKHFRIGNKDYIVFASGETLKILNRQGDIRINVNEKIRFSENTIHLYQNKFTTTNTVGQLVQVDTKGRVTRRNLNLTERHNLVTTSKTLVSFNENKLNIKSRSINLEFGDYTAPKIFYINDKIYITITDLQSKKVYLFDSQAKAIPNFPVFGTSVADLQKLDNDSGLELITKGDSNTLVVYKLN